MFSGLIGATQDYWQKLDEIEDAYKRNELTPKEVDASVKALIAELGQSRRDALRDSGAIFQAFLQRQGDAVAGFVTIGGLAYVWLALNRAA
jgi:hypothetical protein